MKRKILIVTTLMLIAINTPDIAYGYLAESMSPPMNLTNSGSSPAPSSYGLGYNSSAALRERENDFYRQQRLNQPGISATINRANNYFQPPVTNSLGSSTPSRNADRDYVQSKPLPLKGIYSYDAYGN